MEDDMKRILISGLGGSLFPYLHEKLSTSWKLYYVDADPTLKQLYPGYNFFEAPLVTSDSYFEFVSGIIKNYDIRYYLPLIDEEIIGAIRLENQIDNLTVVSPQSSFAELCLNKYDLMKKLDEKGISSIKTYLADSYNQQIGYPLFLKPVSGRGSRGIRRIDNKDQFDAYFVLEQYPKGNVIIQPNLEGTEYTVGVLVNRLNNIISVGTKRIIKKKGITIISVTETNKQIEELANRVVNELQPKGPLNMQLIIDKGGEARIFEINPRFSTTSIMEFEGGVNLLDLYAEFQDKTFNGDLLRPQAGLVLHRRWHSQFYHIG